MASKIDIIINAVDQYSNTLLGLNQGLQLASTGLDAMKWVADTSFQALKWGASTAYDAMAGFIDLARRGGEFREMENQLNNLADSMSMNAQSTKTFIEDLTDNWISMSDTIKLASKGIGAGFNQEELETIFTFVKRRTEATGESFQAMSERMITALQKGRYSTLADFGLIIEKGETTQTMLAKLSEATKLYGDAGFNVSDKLAAMYEQFERLQIAMGDSINSSTEFGKFFTKLKDDVVGFVRSFDGTAITRFTDNMFREVNRLYEGVSWEGIKARTQDFLNFFARIDFATTLNPDKITALFSEVANQSMRNLERLADAVRETTRSIGAIGQAFGMVSGQSSDPFLDFLIKVTRSVGEFSASVALLTSSFAALPKTMSDKVNETIDALNRLKMEIFGFPEMPSFGVQSEPIFRDYGAESPYTVDALAMGTRVAVEEIMRQLGLPLQGNEGFTYDLEQQMSRSPVTSLEEAMSNVNWPAEFHNLGRFMFNFMVQTVAGAPIPPIMAVTTSR